MLSCLQTKKKKKSLTLEHQQTTESYPKDKLEAIINPSRYEFVFMHLLIRSSGDWLIMNLIMNLIVLESFKNRYILAVRLFTHLFQVLVFCFSLS